jgi:hypothetical protein
MKTKTIRFLKEHTHNGTTFAKDAVIELLADQADTLIALNYAAEAKPSPIKN